MLLFLMASFAIEPPTVVAQKVKDENGSRRFYPDDPLWQDPDSTDIAPVKEFDLYLDYDLLQNSFSDPAQFDGPAVNVNTLDEVPDSSWFTNRLGRGDMTIEELVRGPDTVEGPAPGVWKVTGRPSAGITPKFTIRDSRGDTYLIKLDPTHMPELASAVEIISTKFFHAIGYHVPENYLVNIDTSQLEVEPGAQFRFDTGKWLPIKQSDVEHWLRAQPRQPDGTIRALASKYIAGTPVGQFRHYGTRRDDRNDIYPHELRRELRGYRVFCAWLNHVDSKAPNTFDSFVEEDGRRYILHYLLDFGSTLGSGSTHPQEPRAGYEYYMERGKALKGIFSFGLWSRDWMHVEYPDYPSVGNVEAEFFEPWKWKPHYSNPAFNRMDAADAFWAASIVSRFTDEMIRAVVAEAQMSDPEAEAYLIEVILKRRDKVVNYWISRTNPLDRFEIQTAGTGWQLSFDNAAIRVGAALPGATYRALWSALDNLAGKESPIGEEVELDGARATVTQAAWGPTDDVGYRYTVAGIRTLHPDFSHWSEPVKVTLRDRQGEVDVVGIERPRGDPPVREPGKPSGTHASFRPQNP